MEEKNSIYLNICRTREVYLDHSVEVKCSRRKFSALKSAAPKKGNRGTHRRAYWETFYVRRHYQRCAADKLCTKRRYTTTTWRETPHKNGTLCRDWAKSAQWHWMSKLRFPRVQRTKKILRTKNDSRDCQDFPRGTVKIFFFSVATHLARCNSPGLADGGAFERAFVCWGGIWSTYSFLLGAYHIRHAFLRREDVTSRRRQGGEWPRLRVWRTYIHVRNTKVPGG